MDRHSLDLVSGLVIKGARKRSSFKIPIDLKIGVGVLDISRVRVEASCTRKSCLRFKKTIKTSIKNVQSNVLILNPSVVQYERASTAGSSGRCGRTEQES